MRKASKIEEDLNNTNFYNCFLLFLAFWGIFIITIVMIHQKK